MSVVAPLHALCCTRCTTAVDILQRCAACHSELCEPCWGPTWMALVCVHCSTDRAAAMGRHPAARRWALRVVR